MLGVYIPPIYGNLDFNVYGSADATKARLYYDGLRLSVGVPTGNGILNQIGGVSGMSLGQAIGVDADSAWAIGRYGSKAALDNTQSGIYSFGVLGLGDVFYNAVSGQTHQFTIGGTEKLRIGASLVETNRISLGGTLGSSVDPGAGGLSLTNRILFGGAGTADSTKSLIYADAANGNIFINAPASKGVAFNIAGVGKAYVDSTGLVAQSNLYVAVNQYWTGAGAASSTLTTEWADAGNGNKFTNVPTGKYEQHRVAGVGLLSLGRLGVQGDSAWAIGGYGSGSSILNTATGVCGDTSATYINSVASGSLSVRNGGSEKYRLSSTLQESPSLSLGGTIGSSVDPGAGGVNLTGVLQFSSDGTPDNTKGNVWGSTNLVLNAATNKQVIHRVNGVTLWAVGPSALNVTDAINIVVGTATGTKIGTATTQKLGFFNATPVVQQTGGAATATVVYAATEQSMLQKAYDCLRTLGFLS